MSTTTGRGSQSPVSARMPFYLADVFTDRRYGGNQLGVFPAATGLTDAAMQQIAAELNFPESVFVFPPEEPRHAAKIRIFAPRVEMAFAGHPIVGAVFVLAASGAIPLTGPTTRIVLGVKAGPVAVTIRSDAGHVQFVQLTAATLPENGASPPAREAIADMLGLTSADLLPDRMSPAVVSCGTPFLLVPLRDAAAVSRARPDLARFERVLQHPDHHKVMIFAVEDGRPERIRARMFAPAIGIPEDPATGSGVAAIAGFLAAYAATDGTHAWIVDQGIEMGRPSTLAIEADRAGGDITAIRVGGTAVIVSEGTFYTGD